MKLKLALVLLVAMAATPGCNDTTQPKVTAVELIATATYWEPPGAIQLRTTLRNTGNTRVVVQGRGVLIRFAIHDGSGDEVAVQNPCVAASTDPAPLEVTLDPGETHEHTVPIQGIRWEATPFMEWFTCEAVPLEAGEYRIETWASYHTEGIDEYYTVHGAPVLFAWAGGLAR